MPPTEIVRAETTEDRLRVAEVARLAFGREATPCSEHLGRILAPVAHRHFVFTIPKALRGLHARERPLLELLPRCAFAALRRHLRERAGTKDGAPGFVASIQIFGARFPLHPHVHALVTDGLLSRGGGRARELRSVVAQVERSLG